MANHWSGAEEQIRPSKEVSVKQCVEAEVQFIIFLIEWVCVYMSVCV